MVPDSVSVPVPACVSPPVPPIAPAKDWVEEPVILRVLLPRVTMVPLAPFNATIDGLTLAALILNVAPEAARFTPLLFTTDPVPDRASVPAEIMVAPA